jgi:hypothetical protein
MTLPHLSVGREGRGGHGRPGGARWVVGVMGRHVAGGDISSIDGDISSIDDDISAKTVKKRI